MQLLPLSRIMDIFMPYLLKQLRVVRRVDVVWDSYTPNSLKAHTRQCLGTGNFLPREHVFLKTG